MDDADAADAQVSQTLESHINAVRKRVKDAMPVTGLCWNCEEPVTHLFCDPDCRDDYERRQAIVQRLGKT
jgi:hypothetical protein